MSTTTKAETAPETDADMFFSAASLRFVDEFTRRIGDLLENSALALAREQGRRVVTEDDFAAIIDRLGWSMPAEDDADGR